MAETQTLARRLVRSMLPWFLLLAAGMTAAQIGVQYVSVDGAVDRDLTTLARTLEPSMAEAVWELDQPTLEGLARGAALNAIVTGVRVLTERGEPLVTEGVVPDGRQGSGRRWFGQARTVAVPLRYRSRRGALLAIGRLEIHSSPQVVWGRLRAGIIVSLANSLVLAAGLWCIFFVTIRRQLARTVAGVARTVAGWQERPLDAPFESLQYPYRDELGDLVDALNENRTRLAESMQAISAVNQNLEQIVAARTWELREAKEAAESADRLKSAFLATMSHELRTPLNSIIGFTGVLAQELAGPLNPEQKKQMGMVRGSANHLLELINDVLDLSKIEAGQLQVAREAVELRAVADRVVESVRPLALRKGLALECEVPGPLQVTSDRRRVEQILMNLLGNAIKFTEAGEIRLRVVAGPEAVRIEVRDTGIGIAPGDLELLFRPFFQIDTGLTRKYVGTGLGLSICRRLCDLLGGAITAESTPGLGSTFTVTLPMGEVPS